MLGDLLPDVLVLVGVPLTLGLSILVIEKRHDVAAFSRGEVLLLALSFWAYEAAALMLVRRSRAGSPAPTTQLPAPSWNNLLLLAYGLTAFGVGVYAPTVNLDPARPAWPLMGATLGGALGVSLAGPFLSRALRASRAPLASTALWLRLALIALGLALFLLTR